MTAIQRLTLRASEIRTRLNDLQGIETLSDEQTAEVGTLTTEYRQVETKIQAATVAGDEPPADPPSGSGDPETRERLALVGRCDLGAIVAAAVEHRSTEGAEAELQQALGLTPNQIPLDLLRVETRAVTPAPGSTGSVEQPVVMPVFAMGDARFLGVDMPTVASGDAVFPVLTTRPSVGHKATANSDAIAETDGEFEAEVLKPERLQASFFWRRTEAARFRGMEPSLREALSMGLSEAMDHRIVSQIVSDVDRDETDAADTFATYRSRLAFAQIDGRFASMASDIRLLAGGSTYADMAATYRASESDMNALGALMAETGGVRVSAHIPSATGAHKRDVICRRGMRRDMTAPTWEGVTLIPDEVTQAAKGEIRLTAVMLAAWKVIRTGGFRRIQVQHQ